MELKSIYEYGKHNVNDGKQETYDLINRFYKNGLARYYDYEKIEKDVNILFQKGEISLQEYYSKYKPMLEKIKKDASSNPF